MTFQNGVFERMLRVNSSFSCNEAMQENVEITTSVEVYLLSNTGLVLLDALDSLWFLNR